VYENPCLNCGLLPSPEFPFTWALLVRVRDDNTLDEEEIYVVRYKHLTKFRTSMYEDEGQTNVSWIL
jgi:hypothetical protein